MGYSFLPRNPYISYYRKEMIFMKTYKHYEPEDIRVLRKVLGLTTQELAELVWTTRQTISNIERDKTSSIPTLIAFSVVLDYLCSEQGVDPVLVLGSYKGLKRYLENHKEIKKLIKWKIYTDLLFFLVIPTTLIVEHMFHRRKERKEQRLRVCKGPFLFAVHRWQKIQILSHH